MSTPAHWGRFGATDSESRGARGDFRAATKEMGQTLCPVIGLREKLQETMVFTIKYGGFLQIVPKKPIHWLWEYDGNTVMALMAID